MAASRFFFCSQIHHLGSYTSLRLVSYSVQSGNFISNWHAWTYGNEICLNIYYTRKWGGKRLEPFLTIFTSLPPLFSFHSSRKRPSFIMISSRVSTDLSRGRRALRGIENAFVFSEFFNLLDDNFSTMVIRLAKSFKLIVFPLWSNTPIQLFSYWREDCWGTRSES